MACHAPDGTGWKPAPEMMFANKQDDRGGSRIFGGYFDAIIVITAPGHQGHHRSHSA
jgi:hypothetical protein